MGDRSAGSWSGPPAPETGILLARADGEGQGAAVGNQTAGRVGFFLRVDDFDAAHERMRAAASVRQLAPRRAVRTGRRVRRRRRQPVDLLGAATLSPGARPLADEANPSSAVEHADVLHDVARVLPRRGKGRRAARSGRPPPRRCAAPVLRAHGRPRRARPADRSQRPARPGCRLPLRPRARPPRRRRRPRRPPASRAPPAPARPAAAASRLRRPAGPGSSARGRRPDGHATSRSAGSRPRWPRR